MYLKKSFNKKRNKTQLSFVQGYRINGKVKHKVIQNLGYLEDYLDKYEDPIAYFQQIAKEWNASRDMPGTIEVSLSEKLPDHCSNRKNLGYAIIKIIYAKLCIREFFQNKQRQLPVEYNLNSIFSLLIYNRFLFPSSKKNAFETKDRFLTDSTFHWMTSTGRSAILTGIRWNFKNICTPGFPALLAGTLKKHIMTLRITILKCLMKMKTVQALKEK